MKQLVVSLFTMAIMLNASAQNRKDSEPFSTKTFDGNITQVNVQTSSGSITVVGKEGTQPKVEMFVDQNNQRGATLSKAEIQARIDKDYDVNISADGGELKAIVKPKVRNMDWRRSLNFSFKVYVTPNVSSDLSTSGGSIDLKNLKGKQEFSTSGGSLMVEELSGSIKGRTSGGSISVVDCSDDIDLTTSGGSIDANHCTGNIRLETSGGSVHLKGLNGKITANTSGGNIQGTGIMGDLKSHTSGGSIDFSEMACALETSTSGGNVSVSMKELVKAISIKNSGGNIDLELPKNAGVNLDLRANKIKTTALNNFNGKSDDDNLEGTLNGGGVEVEAHSGSGRINLSFN